MFFSKTNTSFIFWITLIAWKTVSVRKLFIKEPVANLVLFWNIFQVHPFIRADAALRDQHDPFTPSGSSISHSLWSSLPVGWQATNGVQTCNQDIAMVPDCLQVSLCVVSCHHVYCYILTIVGNLMTMFRRTIIKLWKLTSGQFTRCDSDHDKTFSHVNTTTDIHGTYSEMKLQSSAALRNTLTETSEIYYLGQLQLQSLSHRVNEPLLSNATASDSNGRK